MKDVVKWGAIILVLYFIWHWLTGGSVSLTSLFGAATPTAVPGNNPGVAPAVYGGGTQAPVSPVGPALNLSPTSTVQSVMPTLGVFSGVFPPSGPTPIVANPWQGPQPKPVGPAPAPPVTYYPPSTISPLPVQPVGPARGPILIGVTATGVPVMSHNFF